MASGGLCARVSPILLLLLLLQASGVPGEMCVRYDWTTHRLSTFYCGWGCCGEDPHNYCCEEGTKVAVIVGGVAGGLLGLAVLGCLLVGICLVWKGKNSRTVTPSSTTPHLTPYVVSANSSGSSSSGYGRAPPPYVGLSTPSPSPFKGQLASPLPPPPYQPREASLPPYDVTHQLFTPPSYSSLSFTSGSTPHPPTPPIPFTWPPRVTPLPPTIPAADSVRSPRSPSSVSAKTSPFL